MLARGRIVRLCGLVKRLLRGDPCTPPICNAATAEAAGLSPLPRWLQLATQNSIEAILKPLEVMRTAKNPATQLAVANAIGAETIDHEPAQDT